MALVAESLGMTLPGAAAWPAVDGRRMALAEATGRHAVRLALEGPTPEQILTRPAFENAITALMAAGASTNAVVHLLALAGRVDVPLTLDDFEAISNRTPLLVDLKPHGKYLMEHFAYAGGAQRLLRELLPLLHADALTVSGKTLQDAIDAHTPFPQEVIHPIARPLHSDGGIKVLRGNLAPDGALIKTSAASPELLTHRGPAVVFHSKDEMLRAVNDDTFEPPANAVLVLRNAGPLGGPGFPEWGHIPLPKSALRRGIQDMVRISDARMSGTSFGTVVLHISPEAFIQGPLSCVHDGDEIELNVPERRLTLHISDAEFSRRRAPGRLRPRKFERGYGRLFEDHVEQAHLGCDFDFLRKSKR
jgi:dihydroxy-acid dehydratase